MRALRLIAQFFLLALAVCVILNLPWPGVGGAYRTGFAVTAHALFGRLGAQGVVRFDSREGDKIHDLDVILGKRSGAGIGEVPAAMSTERVGYFPTTVLIALVLASPVPWGRKWRALAWGLVLVNLFVAFRMWIQIRFLYSAPSPVQLYEPGPFWSRVLSGSYEFFFLGPACSSMVPLLVWIVVTLRPDDINRLLHPPPPEPSQTTNREWGAPNRPQRRHDIEHIDRPQTLIFLFGVCSRPIRLAGCALPAAQRG